MSRASALLEPRCTIILLSIRGRGVGLVGVVVRGREVAGSEDGERRAQLGGVGGLIDEMVGGDCVEGMSYVGGQTGRLARMEGRGRKRARGRGEGMCCFADGEGEG